MKRGMSVYVRDMLDSIGQIEEYTKGMDRNGFEASLQVQDAVARRLEIIGEASKNLPKTATAKYPQIPWKEIAGMRDVLIHGYFGINAERVWKTVGADLPELKKALQEIEKTME